MYEWELLKKYNVIMKYEEDEVLSMCYKYIQGIKCIKLTFTKFTSS